MSFCRALLPKDREDPGDVTLHAGRRAALLLDHSPCGEAPQPRELPTELKEPVLELVGLLLSQSFSFHSWHLFVPPSLLFSSWPSFVSPALTWWPAWRAPSSRGEPPVPLRLMRLRRALRVGKAAPRSPPIWEARPWEPRPLRARRPGAVRA